MRNFKLLCIFFFWRRKVTTVVGSATPYAVVLFFFQPSELCSLPYPTQKICRDPYSILYFFLFFPLSLPFFFFCLFLIFHCSVRSTLIIRILGRATLTVGTFTLPIFPYHNFPSIILKKTTYFIFQIFSNKKETIFSLLLF